MKLNKFIYIQDHFCAMKNIQNNKKKKTFFRYEQKKSGSREANIYVPRSKIFAIKIGNAKLSSSFF